MTRQGLASNLGPGVQFWSFQFTFNDLTGTSGSGAKTFDLFDILSGAPLNVTQAMTFPRGSVILYMRVKHSVAFAGGSLSAMKVRVGKSGGTTNFFAPDFDVFQAVADGTLQETFALPMGQLTAVTPQVTFTPTGDNCSAATAGVVNIDVLLCPVTTPNVTPTSSTNVL